ncbi:hypothetical protein ACFY5C_26350 [Streptomyces sp. NPDC012935]|uniref:hypothetical protein n=1 Tax=Streptomyces sp. NPDC012935 TaxID=3364857 RepID=UPI00367CC86F
MASTKRTCEVAAPGRVGERGPGKGGRPAKYCSGACRRRAFRNRAAAALEARQPPVVHGHRPRRRPCGDGRTPRPAARGVLPCRSTGHDGSGRSGTRTATSDVPDGRLRAVGQAANGSVRAVGGEGSASVGLRWDQAEHRWEKLAAPGISTRGLAAVPGSSALWSVGIATEGDLVPRIVHFGG